MGNEDGHKLLQASLNQEAAQNLAEDRTRAERKSPAHDQHVGALTVSAEAVGKSSKKRRILTALGAGAITLAVLGGCTAGGGTTEDQEMETAEDSGDISNAEPQDASASSEVEDISGESSAEGRLPTSVEEDAFDFEAYLDASDVQPLYVDEVTSHHQLADMFVQNRETIINTPIYEDDFSRAEGALDLVYHPSGATNRDFIVGVNRMASEVNKTDPGTYYAFTIEEVVDGGVYPEGIYGGEPGAYVEFTQSQESQFGINRHKQGLKFLVVAHPENDRAIYVLDSIYMSEELASEGSDG